MTEAVIVEEKPTATAPRRGRPLTYATKEIKAAAFRERKEKADMVLTWMPRSIVAAYRAEVAAGVSK